MHGLKLCKGDGCELDSSMYREGTCRMEKDQVWHFDGGYLRVLIAVSNAEGPGDLPGAAQSKAPRVIRINNNLRVDDCCAVLGQTIKLSLAADGLEAI